MCDRSDYLHYSPEIAALRAVFTFLEGEGFSPRWDDLLPRFWVNNMHIARGRDMVVGCLTFSCGDLVCLRPNVHKLADFDDVVCVFEIADPGVFDHILRVLKDA